MAEAPVALELIVPFFHSGARRPGGHQRNSANSPRISDFGIRIGFRNQVDFAPDSEFRNQVDFPLRIP
jgi:hypothetical protein